MGNKIENISVEGIMDRFGKSMTDEERDIVNGITLDVYKRDGYRSGFSGDYAVDIHQNNYGVTRFEIIGENDLEEELADCKDFDVLGKGKEALVGKVQNTIVEFIDNL